MKMSLVAVVTDVIRDSRTVIGYGFNSNVRYGQGGLIRDRFAPRLLEAADHSLVNDAGDNFDPRVGVQDEQRNPGGHAERSVAVGTPAMAICDGVAKIADRPLSDSGGAPRRSARSSRLRLRSWRLLLSGQGPSPLRTEMRSYLDRGYTGGASLDDDLRRIESVLSEIGSEAQLAVDANGRFDLETAVLYAERIVHPKMAW
jgi:L-alanine-DL-glutamate epimerase-like enolase superfamily enzyme